MPGPGPARAKRAGRGEDEARVEGSKRVIAHPEAVHNARVKVLRHHVSLPGEAADDRCATRVSQVYHDALLAAVERLKIARTFKGPGHCCLLWYRLWTAAQAL